MPAALLILILIIATTAVADTDWRQIPLVSAAYDHCEFPGKTPTRYVDDHGALRMGVDASSSILLHPFRAPMVVRDLRFEWRKEGLFNVNDAAALGTPSGDDAPLRIGLLIAGAAPGLPWFAPAWLKIIRDRLSSPAGELRLVVAGTPALGGSRWPSPRRADVLSVAAEATNLPDGWQQGRSLFDPPLKVVGLWLMADGDDSGSHFTTWLRSLELR